MAKASKKDTVVPVKCWAVYDPEWPNDLPSVFKSEAIALAYIGSNKRMVLVEAVITPLPKNGAPKRGK